MEGDFWTQSLINSLLEHLLEILRRFRSLGYKHLTTLMGAIYWQSSSFVTLMEFKAVVMIEILVAYIAYTTYRTNRIDSECCRNNLVPRVISRGGVIECAREVAQSTFRQRQ